MAAEVKSETINYEGKSALLISVRNGEAAIGTCSLGYTGMGGTGAMTRLFFVGAEPVINMTCPGNSNKQSNKTLGFAPGFKGYDQKIYDVLGRSFSRLKDKEPIQTALKDLFMLLEDGVYTAYFSDYYPTDGGGAFFWGGYNIPHEVRGTAEQNRVIGQRMYKPCFLVPSQPLDYYSTKTKVNTDEHVRRRDIQGIVYHLSGFHSVLLKGHHGAVSCMEQDIPFRCAVIEKICEPYVEVVMPASPPPPTPAPKSEQSEQTPEGEAPAEPVQVSAPEPVPVFVPEGISGFRSASLKVPLEVFPKDMLRLIIEGRSEYKPRQFSVIASKLNVVRKKAVSNNVLPLAVLERADRTPDYDMVESAYAINSLSDAQLNALLAGDVECNGEVIVSPNFYASIVTACNFLQFTDSKRFVDFTIAIMDNPELAATHEYVAQRALSQIDSKKLHTFFSEAAESKEVKYDKIKNAAQTFVKRYKEKA